MTEYQWCQPTRGQHTLYRVVRGDRHDTQTWLADVMKSSKSSFRPDEIYWTGTGGRSTLHEGIVFESVEEAKKDCESWFRSTENKAVPLGGSNTHAAMLNTPKAGGRL